MVTQAKGLLYPLKEKKNKTLKREAFKLGHGKVKNNRCVIGPWKTLRIKGNSTFNQGLNTNKEKPERRAFRVSVAHLRKKEMQGVFPDCRLEDDRGQRWSRVQTEMK